MIYEDKIRRKLVLIVIYLPVYYKNVDILSFILLYFLTSFHFSNSFTFLYR